ncbi:hypothetical protein AB0F96_29120 [Streptomyces sp. NPDC023998]|uniref:hypothetical protein n=1 Tax=Streptomyces sp. NPDC023998 TaxID=3154597 RepID=UPI0033DC5D31
MSAVRHVLVLPDRDAAEDAAEALGDRFGVVDEPLLIRDALAGEDDAEDAQWLVVVEDPAGRLNPAKLDEFAGEWDGWREEP